MTKDEELAMDLALEALEYIYKGANNQGPHTGISWRCVAVKAEPAIKAIKQARALDKKAENARELGLDYEPEKRYTYGTPLLDIFTKPAPVQEPVAWQERQARRMSHGVVTEWTNWYPCRHRTIDEAREEASDHIPYEWRPLYTSPPNVATPLAAQRTWVGLTDEERDNLIKEFNGLSVSFYKAIEAKLKERNV
jgi:hypothetical protein